MTTITVRDLVKRFDNEKTAVNKVSFAIQEGEFLVLVGPSGCGKTTTLRLLAGLETVTSGEIRFGERLVNEVRPRDRNIGMVFQDYAVFPHLTVFDNIAYGLRSRRAPMALIRQRVTDAARTFRIDHLLMRKPRQLSGGERQRVALARAMARDADLYLFDEPLSNLDAQLRHQAREDILNFHRLKRVVPTVYVTHDQSEAMSMGDRIAVMRAGKIEQIGSGSELYNQPVNLFVAYFIGAPSMNLFDVRLVAESDGVYAIGADQADSGALRLRLSPSYEPVVRMYLGAVVKLGIRPENLHVPKQAPFPVDEDNTLHGTLNEIEPTATGCTAYLSTTSDKDYVATFKIRLPASYIGKEIPLALDMERIHLFDTTTERSLLYGNAVRNTVN